MLPFVRMRSTHFSAMIAVIAALAMVLAAPIHAAHNHGNDPLGHPNCAVCQLHSPACGPIWQPCVGIPLEPLFVLATAASPSPVSTPSIADACRAPPFFVA